MRYDTIVVFLSRVFTSFNGWSECKLICLGRKFVCFFFGIKLARNIIDENGGLFNSLPMSSLSKSLVYILWLGTLSKLFYVYV